MEWLSILQYATPVALAAQGESITQRSGVLQIGLEGIMLSGAFAAASVAALSGSPWLGLLVGTIVGLALSLFSAFFTLSLGADQVVVGTAINLLALGVTGVLFRLQFSGTSALPSIPRLPGPFDPVLGLTLLSAPLLWWILRSTGWGLAIRAAGERPKAVEASGYPALKLRTQAMAVGGILGGLAGAYLTVGIAGSFAENMAGGRGFVAIAMVTFGRWNPVGVLVASLLIGVAESLQFTLQARGTQLPYELLLALPYLIALLVLVLAGKGTQGPSALGQPYRREA